MIAPGPKRWGDPKDVVGQRGASRERRSLGGKRGSMWAAGGTRAGPGANGSGPCSGGNAGKAHPDRALWSFDASSLRNLREWGCVSNKRAPRRKPPGSIVVTGKRYPGWREWRSEAPTQGKGAQPQQVEVLGSSPPLRRRGTKGLGCWVRSSFFVGEFFESTVPRPPAASWWPQGRGVGVGGD